MIRVLALLGVLGVLLRAAPPYTGSKVCAVCHLKQAELHRDSHHAQALRPAAGSPMAERFIGKKVRERSGIEIEYLASDSPGAITARISRPGSPTPPLLAQIEWAFGAGGQAFTPVGRIDGEYFEHRLSWYERASRLSLTPGQPAVPAEDEQFAVGVRQKPATITRCFNCHATNVQIKESRPVLDAMTPGVQCERCHGPGEQHVNLATAGKPSGAAILNTGRFNARNIVLSCAECHRSPDAANASLAPELDDLASIRFQPVGFMASRCFQQTIAKANPKVRGGFSCLSCHDPHQSAQPDETARYSNVCRTCHSSGAAAPKPAPTAPGARTARRPTVTKSTPCARIASPGANCIGCHMKKDSPLPLVTFTDHRIRVYPN